MVPGTRKSAIAVTGASLALVGVLTGALAGLARFVNVETVTIIYLIPVLFAALRGGVVPALIAALCGIAASAYFFYPPIYDFQVHRPIHLIDLVLFITVALVTGRLATTVREARLREQTDALREAIIGSASHELRTPLAAILGAASVLVQSERVAGDPRLASLAHGLREEAERLNDHIQNLLDATRISSAGVRPHPEWTDPADIVNAAARNKLRLLSKHRFKVDIAEDLPLLFVDSSMIERALGQLIENAAKYSPADTLIEVAAAHDGGAVRFLVRDQGGGLTDEELTSIWQRFYRSPRHAKVAGSGLGLWIARAMATACGGHVEAHSEGLGKGTTMVVSVPVTRERDPFGPEDADER